MTCENTHTCAHTNITTHLLTRFCSEPAAPIGPAEIVSHVSVGGVHRAGVHGTDTNSRDTKHKIRGDGWTRRQLLKTSWIFLKMEKKKKSKMWEEIPGATEVKGQRLNFWEFNLWWRLVGASLHFSAPKVQLISAQFERADVFLLTASVCNSSFKLLK